MRQSWADASVMVVFYDERYLTDCDFCEKHCRRVLNFEPCLRQRWRREIECATMWEIWERSARTMRELNEVLLRIQCEM